MTAFDRTTPAMSGTAARTFAVTPGRVYEIRAVLRRTSGDTGGLGLATMRLFFRDRAGREVDPRLCGPDFQLPGLAPLQLETLPAGPADDIAFDAAMASRFVAAPPDAAEAMLSPEDPAEVLHLGLEPLSIHWGLEGNRLKREIERGIRARETLLDALFPPRDEPTAEARRVALETPVAQIGALAAQFAPTGNWPAALATCNAEEEEERVARRLERLRGDQTDRPHLGFIGSARTFRRLEAHADMFLLREGEAAAQMRALDLHGVLIETVPESACGGWGEAFSSLEGSLPARGKTLCAAARDAGLPVRVHVTAAPGERAVWQGLFDAVDAIVVEGDPADWTDPPRGATFVPRATEPALAPPVRRGEGGGTMLVPVASDIFQFPDFAELLSRRTGYDVLVTEADYGFNPPALVNRLPKAEHHAVTLQSRTQWTRLLQESTIVLLNGESLREPEQSLDIAIEAIGCGAIPVIFGPGEAAGALAPALDRVWSAAELAELQRLYRIPWLRERRWRSLWRGVRRDHVWTGAHRAAVLGTDPCPADFDTPRLSAIMVSKRPHLLEKCLETFRGQSHPDRELVLVLNTGALPDPMPVLREGEHVFAVPGSWNIGRCLNAGIARATGRYWAKMDDDDFYSRFYLEELGAFFRATQADVAGGQSVYFHFSGHEVMCARLPLARRSFRLWEDDDHAVDPFPMKRFVSGATLAGKNRPPVPPFSNLLRNCADSEWVKACLKMPGLHMASFAITTMVVYRDPNTRLHTWVMPTDWKIPLDEESGDGRFSNLGPSPQAETFDAL